MTIFSQCCEVETFLAKCARQLGRKAWKLEEEVIVVSFSAFLGGSRAIGKYMLGGDLTARPEIQR